MSLHTRLIGIWSLNLLILFNLWQGDLIWQLGLSWFLVAILLWSLSTNELLPSASSLNFSLTAWMSLGLAVSAPIYLIVTAGSAATSLGPGNILAILAFLNLTGLPLLVFGRFFMLTGPQKMREDLQNHRIN
jgi:hypothetical protein